MDAGSLIFSIARTDDAEWLTQQREDAATNECYSDNDRAEINAAIDARFSQLNLLALSKKKNTEGTK